MSLIIPNRNMLVRKSEILLNARYQLGELALKLISIIYSNVKRSDEIGKQYEIRVNDIAKLLNKNYGEIYNLLDDATDEMLKNPLKIIIGEDEKGKKEWEKFNWISDANYKDGVIKFSIAPRLKPYILDLQQKFVRYRLENILNLRGVYVIRLYEILKDNLEKEIRFGKKRAEIIYSVNDFRDMLEIPKSYQYSSHIKTRMIEKAKREFEKHTDIIFTYEEIKTGRKITHIKFFIYKNPKNYKEEKPLAKQQKEELKSPQETPKINAPTTSNWNSWRKQLLNKGNVIISFSDKIFEVKNGYLFKDKKLLSSEKSFEIWQELYENKDKLKIMNEDEYLQEQIKKAEEQEKNYINQLKTKYKNLIVKFDNGENKEATLLDIKFEDKIFKIYFQIEDKIYTQKFGKIDDVEYVLEQANYLYEVEQKRKSREKSIAILDNLIKKF